ncbi:MAG: U32 family peptidase [Tissierellia bacterium]|nr:U32 family peptidase [Tissierellia bacterium]
MKKVELLAPVGSMESLYAAVQNGAHAVYLGGKLFSARQYAANFDYEELRKAVEYCHLRNVKVYVTVNILIDDGEMKKTLDYIKYLYEINVDGLIVQDLGLAHMVRKIFPDLELHASTQMTINNLPGVIFLKKLGFKRVVLARETPLEEIRKIHENVDIELEVFIHGALCVSYSGQCLMSSILGGRSGNRGKCAQPCRMPYSIVDYKSGDIPFSNWDKKYLLSPRDLNTLENIYELINAGVISLKIEGRMKRPEYVAIVVRMYRKALDLGIDSLSDEDKKDILQIFNRGFTKGITFGDFGRRFISYHRPDNRGVLAGEVTKADKNSLYIKLDIDVEKGDGIELSTKMGKSIGTTLNHGGLKGQIIKLNKINNVEIGAKVYRTSSIELLEKAKKSYERENIKLPIDMYVDISIGRPARLRVKYDENMVEVSSDYIVEEAKKVSLTEERVIEQLSKLNDTVYFINKIELNLEENSFMPVSTINSLRREAIDKLNKLRLNSLRGEINDKEYSDKINKYFSFSSKNSNSRLISISVNQKDQFEKLDLNKLDRIYIGFDEDLRNSILKVKEHKKEVYIKTDRILYDYDLKRLKSKIDSIQDIIDGVSVSNLGTLQFVKENYDLNIHGNIGLNVFNSFTVKALEKEGIKSITLSPELTLNQINKIGSKSSLDLETIGYGYLPLMTMKHCPMSLVKNCKDDLNCQNCKFSRGYGLKDRKGVNFYMERKNNLTTIYNSFPLMVLDSLHKIYDAAISFIRIDFTFEEEIEEIQDLYYSFAKGFISKEEVDLRLEKYRDKGITKGHYYRGII